MEEKRGRPRLAEGQDGDAPRLTIRLTPELQAWVRDQGGSTWVRSSLEAMARGEKTSPCHEMSTGLELDPAQQQWVSDHGGKSYVRQLIDSHRQSELQRLAREAKTRDRQQFFEAVQSFVSGAMKDARKAHGEELAGLEGSVGKRVAGQLWFLLHPGASEEEHKAPARETPTGPGRPINPDGHA